DRFSCSSSGDRSLCASSSVLPPCPFGHPAKLRACERKLSLPPCVTFLKLRPQRDSFGGVAFEQGSTIKIRGSRNEREQLRELQKTGARSQIIRCHVRGWVCCVCFPKCIGGRGWSELLDPRSFRKPRRRSPAARMVGDHDLLPYVGLSRWRCGTGTRHYDRQDPHQSHGNLECQPQGRCGS